MPLIPAPGGQTARSLASSFLGQASQDRGLSASLATMIADEKRRKVQQLLDQVEQFTQQHKLKLQAKKAAEKGSGGTFGKVGGGLGAALALALAIPNDGLSLPTLGAVGLGAGAGATVGGLFDRGPGGAPAVSGPQALSAGANVASIIDKLGLFTLESEFVPWFKAGGVSPGATANAGPGGLGALSLRGGFYP